MKATTSFPTIGSEVPRRGNRFSHGVARTLMRLWGWRFDGAFPNQPRALLVVAPHTSNWDFVIGALAMLALDLRISWLGKHTLFGWPLGPLMRALGGLPVRRNQGSGTVAQAVALFRDRDRLLLALAPEGTRRAVTRWRSGFSLIAAGAGVPVLPVGFDWGRRAVRLGPATFLTGDPDIDEQTLRTWYEGIVPRRPENSRASTAGDSPVERA